MSERKKKKKTTKRPTTPPPPPVPPPAPPPPAAKKKTKDPNRRATPHQHNTLGAYLIAQDDDILKRGLSREQVAHNYANHELAMLASDPKLVGKLTGKPLSESTIGMVARALYELGKIKWNGNNVRIGSGSDPTDPVRVAARHIVKLYELLELLFNVINRSLPPDQQLNVDFTAPADIVAVAKGRNQPEGADDQEEEEGEDEEDENEDEE